MPTNDAGKRTIGSVNRALDVLEALRRLNGATLAELAEEVDLSKGALHTHLATLCDHGFVEHRGDGYALGQRFITFGEYVRNSSPLYHAAKGRSTTSRRRPASASTSSPRTRAWRTSSTSRSATVPSARSSS
ncbi:helix-turn-helix domain-containing protein [Halospeciosus flavus]|uniref:helix-turn-helix domain-containing protein n=1 Tax=Halospeciosus flavus TaxID=3032283 RepID=UPI00361EE649